MKSSKHDRIFVLVFCGVIFCSPSIVLVRQTISSALLSVRDIWSTSFERITPSARSFARCFKAGTSQFRCYPAVFRHAYSIRCYHQATPWQTLIILRKTIYLYRIETRSPCCRDRTIFIRIGIVHDLIKWCPVIDPILCSTNPSILLYSQVFRRRSHLRASRRIGPLEVPGMNNLQWRRLDGKMDTEM